jgi:hypothetical protein
MSLSTNDPRIWNHLIRVPQLLRQVADCTARALDGLAIAGRPGGNPDYLGKQLELAVLKTIEILDALEACLDPDNHVRSAE